MGDASAAPIVDEAALLRDGIDAARAGRADEAIAALRRAAAPGPGPGPGLAAAHGPLGLLLVARGRHEEALPHLAAALAHAPADIELHNALGVAHEGLRRWPDAERCYRAALAVRPDFPEAHANLGNCLRRQGRLDEARTHYARAIALRPDFAAAHAALGNLLQELGEVDAAVAQYRRALAHDPDHVESLNNLGGCLRRQGELDAARAAFERVLALRPDQVQAHCNLAPLKTYAPGDPQVERLLALRPQVGALPGHGQERYWFTIGKMLEDVGRHDEAFAAYAQGNVLKHARTPWDEPAQLGAHRRIAATFTAAAMARRAVPAAVDGPVPVFIVGMPRSGTSLLEQVLSTLPGVHAAGEITALPEVLATAAAELGAGAAPLHYPESIGALDGAALLRVGRRYVDRLRALAPGATHVVDKLPANFAHVGAIHLMLPGARIVHAMRDPMDACFSCFSRLFNADNLGFAYDLATLGRYWTSYDDLMRHWRAVLPEGRMLDMPYETMVADFEAQARRLVAYLGLPWDARCLGFHAHRRVVRTASVAQVCRPLYRSSVARWRPFERQLAPLLEIVGSRR